MFKKHTFIFTLFMCTYIARGSHTVLYDVHSFSEDSASINGHIALESTCKTTGQNQAYLPPTATVIDWSEIGRLLTHTSIKEMTLLNASGNTMHVWHVEKKATLALIAPQTIAAGTYWLVVTHVNNRVYVYMCIRLLYNRFK